jgi:RND family efflux transporter MFP subunit
MKKPALILLVVAVAAIGVGIGVSAKRGSRNAPPMPSLMDMPVTVEVVTVGRGPIRESVRYYGSVEAYESVTILPKVTGILETIAFDVGDRVSKGDLIATIDDAEFLQRLEQAKANLKLAEARLERSRINLASAEREFARSEALVTEGLVPEQQLDLARVERDAARADVDLAEAEVVRARAALDEAQINYDNTRIVAALSGYVDKRRVDPGTLVSPSTPLCTIVTIDPAKVVLNVPESDISLLQIGRPAVVKVSGAASKHEGRIERVAPTVDAATRTTMAEIIVPNAVGALRPGMYADVVLVAREKSDALIVPEDALVRGNGQTSVLRVVDGTARASRVRLGIIGDGRAEVLEGIEEGDVIIVKGQYLVDDGDRVRIASPEDETAEVT